MVAFTAPSQEELRLRSFAGPVNLGNPNEFTIAELAELVLRLVGGRSQLRLEPLPQDDPRLRRPDITLAQEKLGWSPSVGLQDGLARTIAYFKEVVGS